LAFLALGSTGDLSVAPCVGGYLEDSFLLRMDFLRADRVGSEGGSARAMPVLTAGILGEPCSPGVNLWISERGSLWTGNNLLSHM